MTKPDIVVVGAGLFGLTVAWQCADVLNLNVLIIEKRDHIGGNAWSEVDADSGIEVHKYGAHLFHTDNERVWEFVNRFTSFTDYEHRVWARSDKMIYPLPFGLPLLNQFFGVEFTPASARLFADSHREQTLGLTYPKNLAEKAISMVGKPLYEAFIEGYTRKQWATDPVDLSPDIISRIPVRYNYDTRYFTDKYQGQPTNGYALWFNQMVAHPNIEVSLNHDFHVEGTGEFPETLHVYTGALDKFYDYSHGRLPWRTVDFEYNHLPVDDHQGTAVINECDSQVPYTRTIEFKHFHPERNVPGNIFVHKPGKTIVAHEFSRWADAGDEPYYPVPGERSRAMLSEYRILTEAEPGVLFGGRLGTYQYLDMHMAIASALTMFDNKILPRFRSV